MRGAEVFGTDSMQLLTECARIVRVARETRRHRADAAEVWCLGSERVVAIGKDA